MTRNTILAASALVLVSIAGASAQTSTTPAPSTTAPAAAPSATAPATTGSTSATTTLPRVEANTLNKGFRTSKVVGSSVVNANNETIGKIDDLVITPDGKDPYAVVSVGGFLGMGDKLVVVPYSSFSMNNDRMVLAGATKDSLKTLPEYTYTR